MRPPGATRRRSRSGAYAPKADVETLELLASRGFAWAALMVRPYDELATLDRYEPLLDHFGRRPPRERVSA